MKIIDRYLDWLERHTLDVEHAQLVFEFSVVFALVFSLMAIVFGVMVLSLGLPALSSAGLSLSLGAIALSVVAMAPRSSR